MSDEGNITFERRGHVALIGFDRSKKRNAFDVAMYRKLGRAYGDLERDAEARVGVLFAHGAHFTAGLELTQWVDAFTSGTFPIDEGAIDPLGFEGPRLTKPIVCAIQGTCLTIGIELLLATDIRVAARDARFGQIEVKRGIYPVGGATLRLPREVGWGNAMRFLLTGDDITAEEAHRIGLVQELAEPGKHVDRAIEIAEVIAAQAPLGVKATLVSARRAMHEGEAAAARMLLPELRPIMASDDAREGVMSFVERRPARFTGK
jgi:enoyl-CoA hydratase/carnithine racemase